MTDGTAGLDPIATDRTVVLPVGTRIETLQGTVVLARPVPPAPSGWWRCWWCHTGRLVRESVSVAEHRYASVPAVADPARFRLERANDVDDDVREEWEWSQLPAGLSLGARVRRMQF